MSGRTRYRAAGSDLILGIMPDSPNMADLHETRIPTPQATLSGLLPGIPLYWHSCTGKARNPGFTRIRRFPRAAVSLKWHFPRPAHLALWGPVRSRRHDESRPTRDSGISVIVSFCDSISCGFYILIAMCFTWYYPGLVCFYCWVTGIRVSCWYHIYIVGIVSMQLCKLSNDRSQWAT